MYSRDELYICLSSPGTIYKNLGLCTFSFSIYMSVGVFHTVLPSKGGIVLSHHRKIPMLQAPLIHPAPVSTTQIPTTCLQPMHLPSSSPCPSAPLSQPLPLGNHRSSVECAATPTIVQASAPTIDNCVYSKVDGVLSRANTQSTSTHSDCVTRAEVSSMLTKMESLIMASVNARLLALEEQVSGLTHTVHMLRERCKDTSPSSQRSSTCSRHRPSFLHSSDKTNSLSHQNSHSANSLPFRVVWGTPRSCSSQVVLKPICALLPDADRPSVTVKGSFCRRGSRVLWWYTIMAPTAVLRMPGIFWKLRLLSLSGLLYLGISDPMLLLLTRNALLFPQILYLLLLTQLPSLSIPQPLSYLMLSALLCTQDPLSLMLRKYLEKNLEKLPCLIVPPVLIHLH